MSHFTTIKTKLVEKDALIHALADLGYEAEEGPVAVRGWGSEKTTADLKIAMKKSKYDLGFVKKKETYDIVADWYGIKEIKQKTFVQELNQRYAYHVTKSKLEEKGFTLVEEEESEGRIHLMLRRMV